MTGADSGGTCRVCLGNGASLSLFSGEDHMKTYMKIMACSSVQICEQDGYPSCICEGCYGMLETAFEFKKKCEMSDMKLRSCVPKDVLKVEEEDYNFDYPEDDIFDEDYVCDDVKTFPMVVEVKPFENDDEDDDKDDLPLQHMRNKKKWKSPEDSSIPQRDPKKKKKIIKRVKKQVVSNSIATSLLEGKCLWNGNEWRFEMMKKDDNLKQMTKVTLVKKENTEEIEKERKKVRRKLIKKKKNKTMNLCDTCGQTFKSRYHLKYHIVLKHQDGGRTIKCLDPNCKKSFKLDNYMIRHVKRCHSAKRDFVCNECGKQYAFISSLKQHMKSHSENLVWKQCNFCSQKYRTQKSVDIHVRSVHTGERPSKCTVCDSAFFHDDYLKEHMRLHTGETPYKCPICKRGYAQRGNMKSHMKQHRLSELDEVTKASMKPNYLKLLRDC